MAVILINPFEVPEGKEEDALAFWEKATDFMRLQPGYISQLVFINRSSLGHVFTT
jgi:hypothetical protein